MFYIATFQFNLIPKLTKLGPLCKNDVTVNIEMPDGKTMTIATVFGSTVLDLKVRPVFHGVSIDSLKYR
jgi:hypothetical protein